MTQFATVGLVRPKDIRNVGSVLRAATCYDVASVMIEGERIGAKAIKSSQDTTAAYKKIPVLQGELRGLIPYGAVPVAVDLVHDAESLVDFVHPKNAFYIFGPEDGTLGQHILSWCPKRVFIPTKVCMNLAATVNVVLYDRLAKMESNK